MNPNSSIVASTQEKPGLVNQVLARFLNTLLTGGSAYVVRASAGIQTATYFLPFWEFNPFKAFKNYFSSSWDLAQDLVETAGYGLFLINPPAPECLQVTNKQWQILDTSKSSLDALSQWTVNSESDTFLAAARVLTVASALAYVDEVEMQQIIKELGWEGNVIQKQSSEYASAQALLLTSATTNVAILAFRGTEFPDGDIRRGFWEDWQRNLSLCKATKYGEGSVHEGFHKGWTDLKPSILDKLGRKELYVTGHSQGAALACISLLDLVNEQSKTGFQLKGCILVAPLKVGNEEFRADVVDKMGNDIPLEAVVNQNISGCDPATAFPPNDWVQTMTLAAPPGRFWVVEVGKTTKKPLIWESTQREIKSIANPDCITLARRVALCGPLHWVTGRVGYLSALKE